MTRASILESRWWIRLCSVAMGFFLVPSVVFAADGLWKDQCNINLVIEKYVEASIADVLMVTIGKELYGTESATYGSTPLAVRGNTPMTIVYPANITLTSIKDSTHDIAAQVIMIINGDRITPPPGALMQSINIDNPGGSATQNEIIVTLERQSDSWSFADDIAGTYTGNFNITVSSQ